MIDAALPQREGGDPMVTYDRLFQYTLVLLTLLLVASAFSHKK